MLTRLVIVARVISRQKAAEAVANSSVKLEGKDVMATYKVLTWIVLAPVTTILYGVVAGYIFDANVGLMTTLVLPFVIQRAIWAQDRCEFCNLLLCSQSYPSVSQGGVMPYDQSCHYTSRSVTIFVEKRVIFPSYYRCGGRCKKR